MFEVTSISGRTKKFEKEDDLINHYNNLDKFEPYYTIVDKGGDIIYFHGYSIQMVKNLDYQLKIRYGDKIFEFISRYLDDYRTVIYKEWDQNQSLYEINRMPHRSYTSRLILNLLANNETIYLTEIAHDFPLYKDEIETARVMDDDLIENEITRECASLLGLDKDAWLDLLLNMHPTDRNIIYDDLYFIPLSLRSDKEFMIKILTSSNCNIMRQYYFKRFAEDDEYTLWSKFDFDLIPKSLQEDEDFIKTILEHEKLIWNYMPPLLKDKYEYLIEDRYKYHTWKDTFIQI